MAATLEKHPTLTDPLNTYKVKSQINRTLGSIHFLRCSGTWTSDELMQIRDTHTTWWRHQMETLSTLLANCAGNSPVHGEFPTQRPVTRALIFSLKRLSKQSWGWWFETLSHPLWRHRNELTSGSWHDETKNENHPSIFSNLPVIITTECFVDTPWPVSPIYFFWLRSTNYYYFWRNREAAPTIILHTGVSNEIFQ